ncbi:uncharacterized protein [Littorina saxatilis]|uniref:uncharacterized protein n=1 Tax=Littorina saxatilis TaxID=31220 RepID=UPI0038B6816D
MAATTTEGTRKIHSFLDYVNKDVFLASYGAFLVVGTLCNVVAAGFTINIYAKYPKARNTPKLLPMLATCVVHTLFLTTIFGENFRFYLENETSNSGCVGIVCFVVAFLMFSCLSMLCVAIAVITEAMRVQTRVTLTQKAKMTVTWILVLVSCLYTLVVILVVFYEAFLYDKNNPCINSAGVRVSRKPSGWRGMFSVSHFVPLIITSCALLVLLVAHLTARANARSASHPREEVNVDGTPPRQRIVNGFVPTPIMAVKTDADTLPETLHSSEHSNEASINRGLLKQGTLDDDQPTTVKIRQMPAELSKDRSSRQSAKGQIVSITEEDDDTADRRFRRSLPVVFAASVSIVCNIFVYIGFEALFAGWYSHLEGIVKLAASVYCVQMLGMIIVPICWMLDHDIQPFVCKCRKNLLGKLKQNSGP